MPQFRKKPVVIEAVQILATDFNGSTWDGFPFSDAPVWLLDALDKQIVTLHPSKETDYALWRINTLEDGPDGEAAHIASPGDWIIRGVQGELYACKPDIFETTYEAVKENIMDFGQALHALKNGQKVEREGWNGKGMFLFLVPGSHFKVNRPPLLGIYPEGTGIDYRSHIDMKTAQGDVVPWVASQSDLLAEDWREVGSGLPNHALNAGLREETPAPKFAHPDDIEDATVEEIGNHDIDRDGPIPFNG